MVFSRLINYVSGFSGLSIETAQQVADMLDGRPLPVVRRGQDSQGELLQLLNLFGGLDRDRFQPRDANTIENGTGCTPGLIGDVALRARRRTKIVMQTFALSIDAAWMGLDPYDPLLTQMMGDEHEAAAIDALSGLLDGAEMAGRRTFQNPISWRIVARMLGHTFRTASSVEETARSALGRVNDNPVFIGPARAAPRPGHLDGRLSQPSGVPFRELAVGHLGRPSSAGRPPGREDAPERRHQPPGGPCPRWPPLGHSPAGRHQLRRRSPRPPAPRTPP